MRSLSLFLLFFASLAAAQPLPEAFDQRSYLVTTGNDDWDAGTSLGVTRPTNISIRNTGTVLVEVAYTSAAVDGDDAALHIYPGQQFTLSFPEGKYAPTTIYSKGDGAAGALQITASNMRGSISDVQQVDAAAAADSSRLRYRTFTVGFADFTDADGSETETDPAGAFPAGAVLVSFRLDVTTPITGGTISAVAVDCGVNGASLGDVLTDGVDGFTAALVNYGSGANAKPNAARALDGKTAQCTFAFTGDNATNAAAGVVVVTVYYTIPYPG